MIVNEFRVDQTVSDNLLVGYYRGQEFSPELAFNLAAWLVVMACECGGSLDDFTKLLEQLQKERHP